MKTQINNIESSNAKCVSIEPVNKKKNMVVTGIHQDEKLQPTNDISFKELNIIDKEDNNVKSSVKEEKPLVEKNDRSFLDFATDVFTKLNKTKKYYRVGQDLITISKRKSIPLNKKQSDYKFVNISIPRLATEIEHYIIPCKINKDAGRSQVSPLSLSESKILYNSSAMEKHISNINSLLKYSLPYLKNEKLIYTRSGYNALNQIYTFPDVPLKNNIPQNDAIKIMRDLLSEFCFSNEDYELYLSRAK